MGGGTGGGNTGGSGQTLVCHSGQDLWVNDSELQAHLSHGDTLGSCNAGGGTGGETGGGNAPVVLCHRSGQGQTTLSLLDQVLIQLHLLHGDRLGTCTGGSGSSGSG
jgi:hypothetical protein